MCGYGVGNQPPAKARMGGISSQWLIWQIADTAFPSGGMAHSGGLEAARAAGAVEDEAELREYLLMALTQAGRAAIPFMLAAMEAADLPALDVECDTFLTNSVANKASRSQGLGFLTAATRVFPGIAELKTLVRRQGMAGHWPVLFGAIVYRLNIPRDQAARLFLFVTLRSMISAAVRMGIIGPLAAQAMQHELSPHAEQIARRSMKLTLDDVAQISPVMELYQGLHDRLYSRLFVS